MEKSYDKIKNPNLTLRRITGKSRNAILAMCAFVALLSAKPAFSAPDTATFLTGPAGLSCSEYARDYKAHPTSERIIVQMWSLGFMSGTNAAAEWNKNAKDLRPVQDTSAFAQDLNLYCDQNPLKTILQFVVQKYAELPDAHK